MKPARKVGPSLEKLFDTLKSHGVKQRIPSGQAPLLRELLATLLVPTGTLRARNCSMQERVVLGDVRGGDRLELTRKERHWSLLYILSSESENCCTIRSHPRRNAAHGAAILTRLIH